MSDDFAFGGLFPDQWFQINGKNVTRDEFSRRLEEAQNDLPKKVSYTHAYLNEVVAVANMLDGTVIEQMATHLAALRTINGRLFFLGVGGSAANASHAVNDFRKIAGIEAYAPTDNVAELTARTNDEGWETTFEEWLKTSRICPRDTVFVLSVGGSSQKVSQNIWHALHYAWSTGADILGIVGRDGGYTKQVANLCLLIPTINHEHITPHAESFQSIVLHLLVTHPALRRAPCAVSTNDVNPG